MLCRTGIAHAVRQARVMVTMAGIPLLRVLRTTLLIISLCRHCFLFLFYFYFACLPYPYNGDENARLLGLSIRAKRKKARLPRQILGLTGEEIAKYIFNDERSIRKAEDASLGGCLSWS